MTTIEQRLHDLDGLPATVPAGLAERSWAVGRRQRRRNLRLAVCSVVLLTGVGTGVVVAHPALATPQSTVAAVQLAPPAL